MERVLANVLAAHSAYLFGKTQYKHDCTWARPLRLDTTFRARSGEIDTHFPTRLVLTPYRRCRGFIGGSGIAQLRNQRRVAL